MTRDIGNLVSGACLVTFGIYVISVAAKLPYIADVGPGPGFFPLWLGIGLVILAVLYATGRRPKLAGQSAVEPEAARE